MISSRADFAPKFLPGAMVAVAADGLALAARITRPQHKGMVGQGKCHFTVADQRNLLIRRSPTRSWFVVSVVATFCSP
jgi:hypothetical protein